MKSEPAQEAKRREILILYERASDVGQIRRMLANPFFNYTAVRSMQEAFQLLHQKRVDMVISGVHLEDTDTYEFLNRFKADRFLKKIPFVFLCLRRTEMARYVDHGLALAARALGATLYLSIDHDSPIKIKESVESCFKKESGEAFHEPFSSDEERNTFWSPMPRQVF